MTSIRLSIRLGSAARVGALALAVTLLTACPKNGTTGANGSTGSGGGGSGGTVGSGGGAAAGGGTRQYSGGGGGGATLRQAIARHRRPRTPTRVTGHPRIWITARDLPRLRKLATTSNPIYKAGLARWVTRGIKAMADGRLPKKDDGLEGWQEYPPEMFAQMFAFMSLVSPDAAKRKDYARRARKLLMPMIREAAKGIKQGAKYRDPTFFMRNRSRWWGDCWGTTVDWIYGTLTKSDKRLIRKVFLMWAKKRRRAGTTDYNHPVPVGVRRDPRLLADKRRVRWSLNNYYNGHMRNNALGALAFDPADDPGGKLERVLQNAIGAWYWVTDKALSTVSRGGLGAEGALYSPAALGYNLQVLLALHTSGRNDVAKLGKHVLIENNPFWADMVPGFFHTVAPRSTVHQSWVGPVYETAIYGDAQEFVLHDPIGMFGPLGVYDRLRGNQRRLYAIRWLQVHYGPGGPRRMAERLKGERVRDSIMYFLLLAETPAPTRDPRKSEPLAFHSAGLGQVYARTNWTRGAAWMQFQVGWTTIDHQHGDGNNFGFYRKGEWLTRERSGWHTDNYCTDLHNAVTIGNDRPTTLNDSEESKWTYQRGCQWLHTMAKGKLLRWSNGRHHTYAHGDATSLYNAPQIAVRGVSHATRELVWIKPDLIVTYDRAETAKRKRRFKRLWVQTPTRPKISGRRALVDTKGGQRLVITSLLPAGATLKTFKLGGQPAKWDPMHYKIRVARKRAPKRERFLTVLEARDGKDSGSTISMVQSSNGQWVGARVGRWVVVFPKSVTASGAAAASAGTPQLPVPAAVRGVVVTGLAPGAGYNVSVSGGKLSVTPGGSLKADSGGVVVKPAR